ncbi:MAG: hypothetical protein PWR01_1995 [Clostridiales bacterium]|jgi:DNA-binding NtrC family response regulator|nr:hypothetical protein [Clostridiales bacterium]MDN5280922.1 hypothetical protein [Candidatus Ozemobacter sp.]
MTTRVLLVEDDYMVAGALHLMLERMGLDCDYARNENEAMNLFRRTIDSENEYQIVVVDLVLGENGNGGAELMKQIRELRPQITSILCSGYTSSMVVKHYKEHGFDFCLKKPFSWKTFKELLSENLHEKTMAY